MKLAFSVRQLLGPGFYKSRTQKPKSKTVLFNHRLLAKRFDTQSTQANKSYSEGVVSNRQIVQKTDH